MVFVNWLLKLFIEVLVGMGLKKVEEANDRRDASEATKENAEKVVDLINQGGTDEDIEKASEDLLSGRR